MRISKRQIRRIVEKSCGRGRVREMDDAAPGIGTSYEDVRELARYHTLNGDKDEMLYRDNPIYRQAYDEMMMRESRRNLADNPYAYEGDDVGPGEIPANYQSKLYSALSPLGFDTTIKAGSKYFKADILDALIESESQLRKAGFKNPSIIIDFLKPKLAAIARNNPTGDYRTKALVNAIPYGVFNSAAGGNFAGDPTVPASQAYDRRQPIWNEEEDPPPMISDSYKRRHKMRISKNKLKRIIREEYSRLKRQGLIKESMKNLYGDIQNEILYIGQEQGGELTVQDVVDYLQNYSNDPLGDPRAEYTAGMSYEEVLQIMFDMVDDGMLTGGYEDFFDVHPDYM
jgi:hypothetical protein